MLPKYDELRAGSFRPRLHPNGFIQLDLTADLSKRLHVWPDENIQAQKTRHPIHDHSFAMESTVLTGCLTNLTYEFQTSAYNIQTTLYHAKRFADSQDTVLTPCLRAADGSSITGYLRFLKGDVYFPGSTYRLDRRILHDSIPHGLTATVMTKTFVSEYSPLIAMPKGIEPDNDYRRQTIDEEILWSFIKRALDKAAGETDRHASH